MCDYCSCRSMPVIEDLGADHESLLARSSEVHRAIGRGDHAIARAELDRLVHALRHHTTIEEASLFAGLRAAGEMVDHVDALTGDHAAVSSDVARLDHLDGAEWDAAVVRLLDELRDHISREEYDLFPATLLAIGPGDWDAIEQAAATERAHAG